MFVRDFFLIPIDVPSFKLIEGQIRELQGVVPNTPRAENDQKSQGRIRLKSVSKFSVFVAFCLLLALYLVLTFPF